MTIDSIIVAARSKNLSWKIKIVKIFQNARSIEKL